MTAEIAELVAEVKADIASETVIQIDTVTPPTVEAAPQPETRSPDEELAYRLRQQSILARFGERGLRERDLQSLLDAACEACAEGLETAYAKVLAFVEETSRLKLVAGVGWRDDAEGRASLGADMESPAGFAFQTGQPVLSNHLENEERFRTPGFLAEHGIRRAINVLIQPEIGGRPYGVLEVDSPDEGQFDAKDAVFLDGFASVLGAAIARQAVEKRLLDAVEHQAMMAREMSHRVKNSLGLVSSLLNMQSRSAASEETREALAEAGSRIQAISRVHDQLWRSVDLDSVSLEDFLCQLCEGLAHSVPGTTIDCQVGSGTVPSDVAIPVGLIVNELVTNAMKYACSTERCVIRVRASIEADTLTVRVEDEGPGFDVEAARSNKSLGLRVVDSLVKQLSGALKVELSGGTVMTLTASVARPA
jgi:two-component sensor histidine kinase